MKNLDVYLFVNVAFFDDVTVMPTLCSDVLMIGVLSA